MPSSIPTPLRPQVKVRKITQQGEVCYVLKEPDKQAYYRFSEPQFQLIELFDGAHDLDWVVQAFNERSDEYEYDLKSAEAIFHACKDYQVLVRSQKEENVALLERLREERKKTLLQAQGSVLMMRFKLVDPNTLFNNIIDSMRFMWTKTGIQVQSLLMLVAFVAVLLNVDRFAQDFTQVYLQTQISGVIYIWIIALCAIALHECGHGLTCKHYGGDVHEMGFLLLAFQPCLYCNVNDAWLFANKSHKIQVALAGVWVEMLLAAISTGVWLLVDIHNPVGYIAFVLMTIGTASSLFVNLNPLLKFDGYYILTDWLEIQNLRQNAIAWISYSLKTKILRLDEDAPLNPTPRERRIYLLYGGLVVTYMTLLLSFLALIGYHFIAQQFGFFAILGFIYLVWKLFKMITGTWANTMKTWLKKQLWSTAQRRYGTGVASLAALMLLVLWQPPLVLSAHGVINSQTHQIYAPGPVYVESVNYDDSRHLASQPQAPLLTLRSPELELQQTELQGQLKAVENQRVGAMLEGDSSQQSRLVIKQAFIKEQLTRVQAKLAALVATAPEGQWQVAGLPPDMLIGRYFSEKQEILSLVSQNQRYFDAIVDQRDLTYVNDNSSARVQLKAQGAPVYAAQVINIAPVGTSSGVEQRFLVRMQIADWQPEDPLPLGLSGNVKIFGDNLPLWQHFLLQTRKFFRADLWL